MSRRSIDPTPLTSPSTSTFRTPGLLSPTSTFEGSNRRHGTWRSQPLPINSAGARRPSHLAGGMAMRQDSSASTAPSASGTSTPDYAKRAKRIAAKGVPIPAGTQDWAGVPPDDIFRRLPVGEVRKVEAKMRGEAFHKQAELRSMVGTRYRDLLTSATQITALHGGSQRLSSGLKKLARDCRSTEDGTATVDQSEEQSEAEEVMNMLPVAAHMKLLLDAPEALYGYLGRSAFLDAAFLWLVSRVVKEGLASMPEDAREPYMPLLEKQWEILLPFRSQIVGRATAALKARDTLPPKTLSECLLAIILLDNLPLPDTLSLLLSQRSKALQEILSRTADLNGDGPASPARRKRSASSAKRGPGAAEREATSQVLVEAAECILDTVSAAMAVFGPQRGNAKEGEKEESLMETTIRLIQLGEPAPQPAPIASGTPTPMRRTSHERRTSRLLSLSLPTPPNILTASGPPVSSLRILQTLPSAQIYLRHLPPSILGFTPFITPSTPPALPQALGTWQTDAIRLLAEAVPAWLRDLKSITDIWHIRSSLNTLLAEGDLQAQIRQALESKWGERIAAVWQAKLGALLSLTGTSISQMAQEVQTAPAPTERDPSSYLFSDLVFPNAHGSTLAAPTTSFHSFVAELKKRRTSRTPKIDEVLGELEKAAKDIRRDSKGLPEALYASYGELLTSHLQSTIKALEIALEGLMSGGDGKSGLEAELFVGRVALFLAKKSNFLDDLKGEAKINLDDTIAALMDLHKRSTSRWQSASISTALAALEPIFDPLRGPDEVKGTWQGPHPVAPSPAIISALHGLCGAVRALGIPPGVPVGVVPDLLQAFVKQTGELPGWASMERESAVQAAVDLAFLGLVESGKWDRELVRLLLAKAGPAVPPDFATQLPSILHDNLRRSQLLLASVLAHLDPNVLGPPLTPSVDSRSTAGLLRFGAPTTKGGVGVEFRSPIAVAKPGKRFNLLSIAT